MSPREAGSCWSQGGTWQGPLCLGLLSPDTSPGHSPSGPRMQVIKAVCPAWTPRHCLFSLCLCLCVCLSLSLLDQPHPESSSFHVHTLIPGADLCVPRRWGPRRSGLISYEENLRQALLCSAPPRAGLGQCCSSLRPSVSSAAGDAIMATSCRTERITLKNDMPALGKR